jgi:hypothetical protein
MDDIRQFEYNGDQFTDTCVLAEFGYYNINAGTSFAQEKLIKVWRMTPEVMGSPSPASYPQAVYADQDGRRVYYDDGLRSITR